MLNDREKMFESEVTDEQKETIEMIDETAELLKRETREGNIGFVEMEIKRNPYRGSLVWSENRHIRPEIWI
jgi:hypothetical protein